MVYSPSDPTQQWHRQLYNLIAAGIFPLVDLPSVGQNLSDQAFIANAFLANTTDTYDDINRNDTVSNEDLTTWLGEDGQPGDVQGAGPLGDPFANQISYHRVSDELIQKYRDFSAGVTSPHLEIYPGVSSAHNFLPLLC